MTMELQVGDSPVTPGNTRHPYPQGYPDLSGLAIDSPFFTPTSNITLGNIPTCDDY